MEKRKNGKYTYDEVKELQQLSKNELKDLGFLDWEIEILGWIL